MAEAPVNCPLCVLIFMPILDHLVARDATSTAPPEIIISNFYRLQFHFLIGRIRLTVIFSLLQSNIKNNTIKFGSTCKVRGY